MTGNRRPGKATRHYDEDNGLMKLTLDGTLTVELVLREIRDAPDVRRCNRFLWNFLAADLSELRLEDAAEVVSQVVETPAIRDVAYRMAFVAAPGPDQSLLRLYDVLMETKEIPGRAFRMFDTEAAAMNWLLALGDTPHERSTASPLQSE